MFIEHRLDGWNINSSEGTPCPGPQGRREVDPSNPSYPGEVGVDKTVTSSEIPFHYRKVGDSLLPTVGPSLFNRKDYRRLSRVCLLLPLH